MRPPLPIKREALYEDILQTRYLFACLDVLVVL